MWEWFTYYSVWILIISGLVLAILLIFGDRVRDTTTRAVSEKRHKGAHSSVAVTLRALEGIALLLMVVAFVAITLSREGVHSIITPQTIQRWFLEQGIRILAIILVGIGLWLALKRFLPSLISRTMAKPRRGESKEGMKRRANTLISVFTGLGKIIIALSIIFMILSELNVPIGPVLAGFGVAGIAVGFGAQYLIRDFIAGFFILLENQYRVGDVARVADVAGLVEEINLRKTVLRDLDGIVHHVPNGEIKVASNYSRRFARVNLDISVAYGTDLDHAISVINRVGQELAADENWSSLLRNVPQVLRVNNLGDSGIDIKVLGEVKPLQQWAVTGELRKRIKKAFDEEGIEIPWPHIKLYLGQSQTDGNLTCKACSHVNLPGSKFCSNCGASLASL